ncbi:MAG TPA: cation-transporting P-type ATPase [Candidatus Lokiarchaeia archaeon]|nr:cation-transporting P-type ATPase [Candidatus Lokiarchaeia archaeon]
MQAHNSKIEPDIAFSESLESVIARLGTDPENGLTTSEAIARLDTYGLNTLPVDKPSFWKLYIAPFIDNWLIILYLIAGFVLLFLGIALNIRSFSSFTLVFVAINAVVAIIQEVRAQKTLDALKQLSKQTCRVIRDGQKIEIEARLIVPGDILDIQAGDKMAADARLLIANSLSMDESSITGESIPVEKATSILDAGIISIQDMKNCVFMGTFATRGSGKAVVISTGSTTEIGKIAHDLVTLANQEIPLKKKINNFAKYLGFLVCCMFVVIIIYKTTFNLASGHPSLSLFLQDLYDSITRAVQFMPINIVLLVTVILFTGVLKLGYKGVIIKNLSATDSFGRVSVVCTDKTGTLTHNEMVVGHIYADGKSFDIGGNGYENTGAITASGQVIDLEGHPTIKQLAICGALDCNAELRDEPVSIISRGRKRESIVRKVVGDPMEAAIIVLAEKMQLPRNLLLRQYQLVKEYPFDAEVKRMTTIWSMNDDSKPVKVIAFSKGATEIMLDLSVNIMKEGVVIELADREKHEILAEMETWSERGYRTLGFALKDLDDVEQTREGVEASMTFLGFVAIMDPPRKGVNDAVKACESAGIEVVMVTGDHPKTALAIGTGLDIYKTGDIVVEGKNIGTLAGEDFQRASIFARVNPHDKETIVEKYQDLGKVVAMTGDGVNDALALGMADVGIAMGISGTDVAKEAADIILSDDSFNSIVLGIREGRAIFAKIRAMIFFFVYVNLTEATFLFMTSFIPNFIFITPMQVYLIVGLSHGVPPLGLTFDRTSEEIMTEKPRNAEEIFNKNSILLMTVNIGLLVVGFIVGFCLVYQTFIENVGKVSTDELENLLNYPRTLALGIILAIEIFTIFSIRRPNIPVWKTIRRDMSPFLLLVVGGAFGDFVLGGYFPIFGGLWFSLKPLKGIDWFIIVAFAIGSVLSMELAKHVIKKKRGLF